MLLLRSAVYIHAALQLFLTLVANKQLAFSARLTRIESVREQIVLQKILKRLQQLSKTSQFANPRIKLQGNVHG